MKKLILGRGALILIIGFTGCKKKSPTGADPAPSSVPSATPYVEASPVLGLPDYFVERASGVSPTLYQGRMYAVLTARNGTVTFQKAVWTSGSVGGGPYTYIRTCSLNSDQSVTVFVNLYDNYTGAANCSNCLETVDWFEQASDMVPLLSISGHTKSVAALTSASCGWWLRIPVMGQAHSVRS